MSVTAIRAPGNGRGTDIGFERRPVPGEARRIAANIAKLPAMSGPSPSEAAPSFLASHEPRDGPIVTSFKKAQPLVF